MFNGESESAAVIFELSFTEVCVPGLLADVAGTLALAQYDRSPSELRERMMEPASWLSSALGSLAA
jgi:hypothetical protein